MSIRILTRTLSSARQPATSRAFCVSTFRPLTSTSNLEGKPLDEKIFRNVESKLEKFTNLTMAIKHLKPDYNDMVVTKKFMNRIDPIILKYAAGGIRNTKSEIIRTSYIDTEFAKNGKPEIYHFETKVRTYYPERESDHSVDAKDYLTPVKRKLIYFHGGGYTICTADTFHPLMRYLSNSLSAEIYAVDYKSSPEVMQPYSINECIAAAKHLLARHPNNTVSIAGDSAGGHATLSAILDISGSEAGGSGDHIRNTASKQHLPKSGILIYPWLAMDKVTPSWHTSFSEKIKAQNIIAGFVLNLNNNNVKYNLESMETYLDIFNERNSKIEKHDQKMVQDITNFINNPKITLSLRKDEEFSKIINSGIDILLQVSELDSLYDIDIELSDRLNRLNKQRNSKKQINIQTHISKGTCHGWFQMFASQARHGKKIENSKTPEHDAEFDRVIKLMKDIM